MSPPPPIERPESIFLLVCFLFVLNACLQSTSRRCSNPCIWCLLLLVAFDVLVGVLCIVYICRVRVSERKEKKTETKTLPLSTCPNQPDRLTPPPLRRTAVVLTA